LPDVWDDTRFLDGYPGKFAVFARRGGGRWYVAGINAEETTRKLTLDLRELSVLATGTMITDGEGGNMSFKQTMLQMPADKRIELTIGPRGGVVMAFVAR
jgi:hypothetical protein